MITAARVIQSTSLVNMLSISGVDLAVVRVDDSLLIGTNHEKGYYYHRQQLNSTCKIGAYLC
jgi:hypothetical protein